MFAITPGTPSTSSSLLPSNFSVSPPLITVKGVKPLPAINIEGFQKAPVKKPRIFTFSPKNVKGHSNPADPFSTEQFISIVKPQQFSTLPMLRSNAIQKPKESALSSNLPKISTQIQSISYAAIPSSSISLPDIHTPSQIPGKITYPEDPFSLEMNEIAKRHDDFMDIITMIEVIVFKKDDNLYTDENFESLISYCQYHQTMDWGFLPKACTQFVNRYIVNSLQKDNSALQNIVNRLKEIKLDCINLSHSVITDEQLDLFMSIPLNNVILKRCNKLTALSVHSLYKIRHTLKNLVIDSCDWVSNDFVAHLKYLNNLEYLSLEECNGKELSADAYEHLVELPLTALNLSYCLWFKDTVIEIINENNLSARPLFKNLKCFYLKGTLIKNSHLIYFLTFLLQTLDISYCPHLNANCLNVLRKYNLAKLYISNNAWFQDFRTFSNEDFRNLKMLDASSTSMTNEDLGKLSLLRFQKLKILKCSNLSKGCVKLLQGHSTQTVYIEQEKL